jgi:drug/metabolite transporter (DMT)-like permease
VGGLCSHKRELTTLPVLRYSFGHREGGLRFLFLLLIRVLGAGVLMIRGYLLWLGLRTNLNLSYAYPIACSSVVPVAFLSTWLLGEKLTVQN